MRLCPFRSWMSKNAISSCICLLDKQHISSISSLGHILPSFSPIVPIILPLSKSIPKRRWFIACFGIYRTLEISLRTEKNSFIWWAYSRMAIFSASSWNNSVLSLLSWHNNSILSFSKMCPGLVYMITWYKTYCLTIQAIFSGIVLFLDILKLNLSDI